MKRNRLAVLAAMSAAAVAIGAPLSPLPVSRAPFEQSAEVVRRPVTLASWPFHPTAGWNLLGEERLTTWAEFRSGDKFAVANGCDGRIHFVGRTGFGKVLFYRGGSEKASPTDCEKPDPYGRELLAWLELRVLDGSKFYTRYMECYTNATINVDAEAKTVSWSRPCKGSSARYSLAPDGDGRLALEWNIQQPVEFRLYLCGDSTNGTHGVENGTLVYVKERIELVFPDGVIECGGQGAARPTGSTNPAPDYVWRTDAASGRMLIDLCGSTVIANSSTPNSPTPNSGIIDFWECDALDVPRDPTGNFLANGSFELGLVDWNYWWGGEPWYMVAETGEPLEAITGEAKVGERALRMRRSKTRDKYEALQSAPMSLEPGVEHVLSAWVKRAEGELGEANITFMVDPVAKKFHVVTKPDGGEAKLVAMLADDEWHFVELPFVSECGDCKVILDGSGAAAVVDGVRVERVACSRAEARNRPLWVGATHGEATKPSEASAERRGDVGGKAGSPCPPQCVEARLETSSPDNLLHFGEPVGARLVLSGPDGAKGAVRVTVRNFYNETVFKKAFKFKMPEDKIIPLRNGF